MSQVTTFTGYVWTVGQTGREIIKSCFSQCGEVTLVLSLCLTGSSYGPHMLASRNCGKIKVLCIGDRCHRLCTYCLLLLPCFSILFSFCQSLIQSSAILKRLLSYIWKKSFATDWKGSGQAVYNISTLAARNRLRRVPLLHEVYTVARKRQCLWNYYWKCCPLWATIGIRYRTKEIIKIYIFLLSMVYRELKHHNLGTLESPK